MNNPVATPVQQSEPLPKPTKSQPRKISNETIMDPQTMDEFRSAKGKPFVADFFGIDSSNDEFIDIVSDVSEYLYDQTDGSLGMAKEELGKIKEILNLQDADSGFHNINKVREFIAIKMQQQQMQDMMEQAEKDAIEGLTDDDRMRAKQQTVNRLKDRIASEQELLNKARKKALADIKRLV